MAFGLIISALSLLIGYFAPGLLLSFLFFRSRELGLLERLAVSMAFSIALIGMLMTYLGMSAGFSVGSTLLIIIAVSALAYYARRTEIDEFFSRLSYSPQLPHLTVLEGTVLSMVLLQLFFTFYYSAFFPIDGGDAVTFHAPFEKLYAESGRLVQAEGVLEVYNPLSHGFHLFISWFYMLNGADDIYSRIAPPILFLGSCIFLHSIACRLFGRKHAALSLLIFANTPLLLAHAQVAYLNLPELFFILAGMFCLLVALRHRVLLHYMASGALGGFAALVKPSGIVSFGLLSVLLVLYFNRKASAAPLLALAAGALLSGSIIWFAANLPYYLDPSSTFYLFSPYAPHSFPEYSTFFFYDNQVAVNQGIGPFFISFGLVGLVLMYAKRERKWEESFSLAWLAAMFVLSELFLLKLGSRFAMPSLPVTAIFAAYGFERLSSSKSRLIALLAFLLLAAELAPSLAIGAIGFKSARISYETNIPDKLLFPQSAYKG